MTENSKLSNFVYFKAHTSKDTTICSFCDPHLLSKTFSNGKIKLKVSEKFYKGKLISKTDALRLLSKSRNNNVVGSLAVLAVKRGLAHPASILWIKDSNMKIKVPHLLIVRF